MPAAHTSRRRCYAGRDHWREVHRNAKQAGEKTSESTPPEARLLAGEDRLESREVE